MGKRGPLPDPNSRRSLERIEQEKRRQIRAEQEYQISTILDGKPVPTTDEQGGREGADNRLQCPKGLPVRVETYWRDLVAELRAAKVPLQQIDSHIILEVARCLYGIESAEEFAETPEIDHKTRLGAMELAERRSKRLDTLLPMIGATPQARIRLSIHGEESKKRGPLEQLLARRAHQSEPITR